MKILIVIFIFNFCFSYSQTTTQIISTSLEQRLVDLGIDSNGITGDIRNSDLTNVTTLNLDNDLDAQDSDKFGNADISEVVSLFPDLEILYANNNLISTTAWINDLSSLKKLYLNNNVLTGGLIIYIDLEELYINNNSLQDLVYNNALKILECSNNLITDLNIRNLEHLDCSNNQISSLAVLAGSYSLEYLNCRDNLIISLGELFNYPNLSYLDCRDNLLQNLNVSNTNLNNLWFTEGNNNTLEVVDISNIPQEFFGLGIGASIFLPPAPLISFKANNTLIHSLGISNTNLSVFEVNNCNLNRISVTNSNLSAIDVSTNPNLSELVISNNPISTIDIQNNPLLWELRINNTNISSLDTSLNPNLYKVNVENTLITDLDFSNNTQLAELRLTDDVGYGPNDSAYLESLNISNTAIPYLGFDYDIPSSGIYPFNLHALKSFTANNCSELFDLQFRSNSLETIEINNCPALENLLIEETYQGFEQPNSNVGENFNLSNLPNLKNLVCKRIGLTDFDFSDVPSIESLDCSHNLLTEIDLSNCTELNWMDVSFNDPLVLLDFSNTKLEYLTLGNSRLPNLATINANNCHELYRLSHGDSDPFDPVFGSLTELNVENCTSLEKIYIMAHPITSIDLSDAENLTDVHLYNNNLTSLNLKNGNNSNFTGLYVHDNSDSLCIEVDDALQSYENPDWSKDSSAIYSNLCGSSFGHPDYPILDDLYTATNGDLWTSNTNWLDPNQPISNWFGIFEVDGRVEYIYLSSNNLSGVLPPSLGNLNRLTSLEVDQNNLEGEIPNNLVNAGADSENVFFNFSYNNFTGQLSNWSAVPDPINTSIFLQGNLFGFSDLEPLVNNGVVYEALLYSPQGTQDLALTIQEPPGSDITLSVDSTTSLNSDNNISSGINNVYQWYKDGVIINGANTDTYTIFNAQIEDSGEYSCEITNSILPDLIILTSPITVDIDETFSIEDVSAIQVSIYPNPTNNWLNINTNLIEDGNVKIFDLLGNLIIEKALKTDALSLNIETFSAGLYIVKIETQNQTITKKIVKN